MDLRERLFSAVLAEPGEWTADQHAEVLGVTWAEARQAAYRLAEAGRLAPRAYRLHEAAGARLRAGATAEQLVGRAYWRADARETACELVRRLESGPLSGAELAGGDKLVLRDLHRIGVVSLPGCLWPAGCDEREEAA